MAQCEFIALAEARATVRDAPYRRWTDSELEALLQAFLQGAGPLRDLLGARGRPAAKSTDVRNYAFRTGQYEAYCLAVRRGRKQTQQARRRAAQERIG